MTTPWGTHQQQARDERTCMKDFSIPAMFLQASSRGYLLGMFCREEEPQGHTPHLDPIAAGGFPGRWYYGDNPRRGSAARTTSETASHDCREIARVPWLRAATRCSVLGNVQVENVIDFQTQSWFVPIARMSGKLR